MHKGPKLPAGWPRSGSINFDGGELSWRWHASASPACWEQPPPLHLMCLPAWQELTIAPNLPPPPCTEQW